MAPTTTRPAADILASASALASSLTDQSSSLAAYYLKVMTKWSTSTLEETQTWLEKEQARLGKLASRKGAIAGKKLDELRMKQNVRQTQPCHGMVGALVGCFLTLTIIAFSRLLSSIGTKRNRF